MTNFAFTTRVDYLNTVFERKYPSLTDTRFFIDEASGQGLRLTESLEYRLIDDASFFLALEGGISFSFLHHEVKRTQLFNNLNEPERSAIAGPVFDNDVGVGVSMALSLNLFEHVTLAGGVSLGQLPTVLDANEYPALLPLPQMHRLVPDGFVRMGLLLGGSNRWLQGIGISWEGAIIPSGYRSQAGIQYKVALD
ncbi:MAG: hypothetical protein A3I05_05980 [Deltaproteobacteria bacterium RIFCSPLOWO2_02_FULL_44_10]|nr:MAG: hypothetical protein A3C46_04795 [Deltaproteobacteria bacterium RIFCSPHIGHO2_02_FULL_44_16]OGQ46152.1 MAG: hypothetical protein A3I05_05980 [Deltaproteobacteria bacterium RIFCSPLOWO2_02_FULL_44_10]